MKKSKVAMPKSDLARTPPEAMAAKHVDSETSEEDKLRKGEWDLEDLMKAEEIKGDQGRMEYVHKAHAKKTTQMRSIADLKVAAEALAEKERQKIRYPKREK